MTRTYRLDLPNDINELATLKSRKAELGYAIFRSGAYNICICHADKNGILDLPENVISTLDTDVNYVCCCYPAAVKDVYPQLRDIVVGDWNTSTRLRWYNTCIRLDSKQGA